MDTTLRETKLIMLTSVPEAGAAGYPVGVAKCADFSADCPEQQ